MKAYSILLILMLTGSSVVAHAQQKASVTIDGHAIALAYSAPATKTCAAASFHTESDVAFKGISVPKGDYTLYVLAVGAQWQLAVNKATGPKAATYDPKLDLGKVAMTMAKAPAPAATCNITLTKSAAMAARVEVTWNDSVASAAFHLDRASADSEW